LLEQVERELRESNVRIVALKASLAKRDKAINRLQSRICELKQAIKEEAARTSFWYEKAQK